MIRQFFASASLLLIAIDGLAEDSPFIPPEPIHVDSKEFESIYGITFATSEPNQDGIFGGFMKLDKRLAAVYEKCGISSNFRVYNLDNQLLLAISADPISEVIESEIYFFDFAAKDGTTLSIHMSAEQECEFFEKKWPQEYVFSISN